MKNNSPHEHMHGHGNKEIPEMPKEHHTMEHGKHMKMEPGEHRQEAGHAGGKSGRQGRHFLIVLPLAKK